jgi:hypothetical protein
MRLRLLAAAHFSNWRLISVKQLQLRLITNGGRRPNNHSLPPHSSSLSPFPSPRALREPAPASSAAERRQNATRSPLPKTCATRCNDATRKVFEPAFRYYFGLLSKQKRCSFPPSARYGIKTQETAFLYRVNNC